MSISRLNRREWIETASRRPATKTATVSPGLTAGSGLKPSSQISQALYFYVSPGLTAGSGLKRRASVSKAGAARISRLNRREWIETGSLDVFGSLAHVSPGLTAGSGLKQTAVAMDEMAETVSPGLTAGSGLKPYVGQKNADAPAVSPGLTAGSGLKQAGQGRP